jgi:anhydro-N-acetylmuramic acid kinase
MVYRAIGVHSGSSLNGLDIAFVELQETTGKWTADIIAAQRYPYEKEWVNRLTESSGLHALDYQLLDVQYGGYIADNIKAFITTNQLEYKIQLIACHGHTSFYLPGRKLASQLGDGATIAAQTGINVVTDLRAIDLALGGKGAPIIPVYEKLIFPGINSFLHLGSIASLVRHLPGDYLNIDVCPVNKLLDSICARDGKAFDPGGMMASEGKVDIKTLEILNELEYYHLPWPKTLSTDFGTDVLYPLFDDLRLGVHDALRTAIEHIACQVASAVKQLSSLTTLPVSKMLVTGGGANNDFLVLRIREMLQDLSLELVVPDILTRNFKDAVAIALIGVLRWREENNGFGYITSARRDSIGGAVWIGQEA